MIEEYLITDTEEKRAKHRQKSAGKKKIVFLFVIQ